MWGRDRKRRIEACFSSPPSPNLPLKSRVWRDANPDTTIVGLVLGRAGYTGFHLARKKETAYLEQEGKKVFDESQRNKPPQSCDEEETKGVGL